jgi:hypothetical protein
VAQFAPSNPTGHWQVSATQVPPFWHVTAQSASSSPQLIMNAVGMMMTDKNKIMFACSLPAFRLPLFRSNIEKKGGRTFTLNRLHPPWPALVGQGLL